MGNLCLGDWISTDGLSQSASATVKKRKGLATASIYEIRAIVEDCRSNIIGGLQTGIDLWEAAVIPMLLFNAETWVSISKSTVDVLEDTQKRFYRSILSVSSGCPIPSLYLETGGMLMKNRILLRKLLFLHHLATLPDTSLAKEVYTLQTQLNLPGLVDECQDFLRDHELSAIDKYTRCQWKRLIKQIIVRTDFTTRHRFIKELNERRRCANAVQNPNKYGAIYSNEFSQ